MGILKDVPGIMRIIGAEPKVESLCFYSMMDGVTSRTKFNRGDITKAIAMCFDLEKTINYLRSPEIIEFISSFDLELYGFGNVQEVKDLKRVRLHQTKERLNEHYTILEMNNKPALFWYEPFHETVRPTEGGFLLSFDNADQKHIQKIYDNFRKLER